MANDIRILINGQSADVFESRDFPLKLDFQIEDVNDFTARKGSGSSATYRLPATQKNSKIFGLFGRISPAPIDAIKTLFDAVIEVGNIPVLTGKARLLRVVTVSDYTGRRGFEYEIAFIAENADWFSELDGLTLQNIDWSDLDHELNIANITAGWGALGAIDDYGYTLIKWKDWINTTFVTYPEFTPFLFANTILERAFNLIGYTVDSNFITQNPFVQCMHPVPLKNYGADFFAAKTDVRATRTTTTVGVASQFFTVVYDDDSTPPNTDPNGNYNTGTGVYTAPYTAVYRFRASVRINNAVFAVNPGYRFYFLINGAVRVPAFPVFTVTPDGFDLIADETFTLNQNDTVVVHIEKAPSVTSYDVEIGNLEVEGQNIEWTLNDTDVLFDFLVPDWPLKDYIKGLTEMFNLYIYADSAAKTVRIETRDFGLFPFIDGENDISTRIDLNKRGEKSFVLAEKELIYKYKEDSRDATTEQLNDGEVLPIFAGRYVLSDPNATGRREIENSFFAPTIGIRDTYIAGFAGQDTPPLIPFIFPENYNETQIAPTTDWIFTPRILYHQGVVAGFTSGESSPEGSISLLVSQPASRNAYPKSFMVDYDDPSGIRPSLAYGQTTTTFGTEKDGLLKRYYLNQLASINNGVQRVEWWRAKITDIINETFRNRVLISGERYILQKIDGYNPTRQDSTKVILLEDKCATSDDVDAIESPTVKGVVNNGNI